jgi:hypothetical protein
MNYITDAPVKVKTFEQAKHIAKAIRQDNPEAATEYLAKFPRRQSIERGALDNWLGIERRDG